MDGWVCGGGLEGQGGEKGVFVQFAGGDLDTAVYYTSGAAWALCALSEGKDFVEKRILT